MNVWVTSGVTKWLKTYDLKKLGNFKKTAEMISQLDNQEEDFECCARILQKISCKALLSKTYFT